MKWISVKDELPSEVDEQYICNCTHENDGELVIALIWDGEYWGENDYCDDIDWNKCVTHWMKMPKPFKTQN